MKIRIYGEKGSIEWQHADCNTLTVRWPDAPTQVYRTGAPYLGQTATYNTRAPAGHPEGFIEAFANIYRNFARTVQAKKSNPTDSAAVDEDFPGAHDGVRGLAFIEACLVNSKENGEKWTELKEKWSLMIPGEEETIHLCFVFIANDFSSRDFSTDEYLLEKPNLHSCRTTCIKSHVVKN